MLRTGASFALAGVFLLGSHNALQTAVAEGDTRTISFHHLHTGEDITITYKREGRYDDAALKKLDWFMRDWRKEQSISMDPHLFDLLWETNREVGGTDPIQVVCGYRSPATNAMLRARSSASGVAEVSQHSAGHAMDFFMPGVPLAKIREVGLQLQRGGVGFYPTSGSPFVHLDTGAIRHWPRMTHDQLVKVFPDGRTVHVPSDGVPLRGYAQALADVEARGSEPSSLSLAAARAHGVQVAGAGKPSRSLFAMLFGKKPADSDDAGDDAAAQPAYPTSTSRVASASMTAPEKVVPLPAARPRAIAVASNPTTPVMVAASLSPDNVFANRGYWHGNVDGEASAPKQFLPFQVASADVTGAAGAAMAYAPAEPGLAPADPARARPMGATLPVAAGPIEANTTIVDEKPVFAPTLLSGAQSPDSPWMRAALLTPSVSGFMTATQLGERDARPLRELFVKPSHGLAMAFSADEPVDMAADKFSGSAVVFLATTTFAPQTTASLR